MNRIILSLAVIAMAGSAAVATTRAYFSNGQVLGNNTFSTGTVVLNQSNMSGLPISMTNLAPNESRSQNVDIKYTGTLNADVYLGTGGKTGTTDPKYFANHLNIVITDRNDGSTIYTGTAAGLSGSWTKLMTDIGQDQTKYLKLVATLDPNIENTHQGVLNDDTVFLFYSVQHDGSAPTGAPYTKYTGTNSTFE